MVFPTQNCKAALPASEDPSFETARKESHDDVPIYACKTALNEEKVPITVRGVWAVHAEAPGEVYNRLFERCCNENDDMIAWEVKFTVKQLAAYELTPMVDESLNDIVRTLLHN